MSETSLAPPARLSAFAGTCDALLCDVFGTLHDASGLFDEAADALLQFRRSGGIVILVSNSPSSAARLAASLAQLGLPVDAFDDVVTSSDLAFSILADRGSRAAHHIGTAAEREALDGRLALASVEDADAIICTGFPDNDFEPALMRGWERGLDLYCTNPDVELVVGTRLLRFAGVVAKRYRALGGTVVETGKPAPAIFSAARARAEVRLGRPVELDRTLCIGDSFALDVEGALTFGSVALWIAGDRERRPVPRPLEGLVFQTPALAW